MLQASGKLRKTQMAESWPSFWGPRICISIKFPEVEKNKDQGVVKRWYWQWIGDRSWAEILAKLKRLGFILKASGKDWIEGFSLIKITKKKEGYFWLWHEKPTKGCNHPGERRWVWNKSICYRNRGKESKWRDLCYTVSKLGDGLAADDIGEKKSNLRDWAEGGTTRWKHKEGRKI